LIVTAERGGSSCHESVPAIFKHFELRRYRWSSNWDNVLAGEKEWVQSLQPRVHAALQDCCHGEWTIRVDTGKKLTYAHEIEHYGQMGVTPHIRRYETDLLVSDTRGVGDWIPRVVVECKLGSVTTHDALTYSTKAATHKHVHPYLRYGVLVCGLGAPLPGRLVRHGAYFDFMMVWASRELESTEWEAFVDVLKDEINASRILQGLVGKNKTRNRHKIRLLHRPLRVGGYDAPVAECCP
jgi:hypothetical protein